MAMKKTKTYTCEYQKPMKLKDQGEIIEMLSVLLAKHGSNLKKTDKFHIGMRSAVIGFQKKHNLKPTGVVDKKTWTKLLADAK